MGNVWSICLVSSLLAACAVTPADDGAGGDDGPAVGGGAIAEVFAITESALFRLDPTTKALTKIGAFDCVSLTADPADSQDGMTDIAADANGALFGVGRAMGTRVHTFYAIDRATAHCAELTPIMGTNIGGLSFAPAGVAAETEAILALDSNGTLDRFDPSTGAIQFVGVADQGWGNKSADLVSIDGDRTYTTNAAMGGDHLIALDPRTGKMQKDIGPTGVDGIWGLGYWGGSIYGFTYAGKLFAISSTDASATEIAIPNVEPNTHFVGAAVTTAAPIVLL